MMYTTHEKEKFKKDKVCNIQLLSKVFTIGITEDVKNTIYHSKFTKYLPKTIDIIHGVPLWLKTIPVLIRHVPMFRFALLRMPSDISVADEFKYIRVITSWPLVVSLVRSHSNRVNLRVPNFATLYKILKHCSSNDQYQLLNILSKHYNIPFIFVTNTNNVLAVRTSHEEYGYTSLYLVDHAIPILYCKSHNEVYVYNFLIKPPICNKQTNPKLYQTLNAKMIAELNKQALYFQPGIVLAKLSKNYIYFEKDEVVFPGKKFTIHNTHSTEDIIPYSVILWDHIFSHKLIDPIQSVFTVLDEHAKRELIKLVDKTDLVDFHQQASFSFSWDPVISRSELSTYITLNQSICTIREMGMDPSEFELSAIYSLWLNDCKK